jgi:hypothetical protein
MPPDNQAPAHQGIAGAYKRKEYGWFIFYIASLVISQRLAGIVGAVVSVLVATTLYKTIKSATYSRTKKIVLSLAYIIVGVVATLVISVMLTLGIAKIWPQAVVPQMLAKDPPLVSTSFVSSTTQGLIIGQSSNTLNVDLETNRYKDAKLNFSLSYPKSWTVDNSGTNGNVEFDDPSQGEVALETVTADDEHSTGYDFQTVVRGVLHNFKTSAGSSGDVKVLAEGNTTLDGEPAYEYELTYNYVANSQSYPFHAIFVISLHSSVAYEIFASSLDSIWSKYNNAFVESISTFQY